MFTVSFSRAPNQLSQWRGYCPQGGYCIEFKEREFSRLSSITFGDDAGIVAESGFKFAECRYDNHDLLIKELKEKIEKRLRASRTGLMAILPNDDVQKHLFFECIDEISDVLPFLKDKNFSEEKEVRLVKFLEGYGIRSFLAANCKFRTGRHYIIPYYELSGKFFNPSQYISKVIVGPGPHKERSAKSLDFFLQEMGMDIDIETSEIPLISW
ncbi:DUF2971 domain-containing protein [Vogesella sp. XCS3]|nr:DUF2971 domain-containing protein [Vogesella sp. XCS3]